MSTTTTQSHYFPPLDKCLAGEERLISWRVAYRALSDESTAIGNSHLEHFFNDPESLAILTSALNPFGTPSPKSEGDFETKTAPINVPQALSVEYNLSELKEDAKWLANQVQIEELAALRIALLELQDRPADTVLSSSSALSSSLVRNADGPVSLHSWRARGSGVNNVQKHLLDFARPEVRQLRLLDVYSSETGHILRLSADLVGRHAVQNKAVSGKSPKNWIDELAANVAVSLRSGAGDASQESFSAKCITFLDELLRRSEDRSLWPTPFQPENSHITSYVNWQFAALKGGLRLLLANLHDVNGIPETTTVHAWFTLMDRYGFLQDNKPMFAEMDIAVPQYLISIISLQVLNVPLMITELINAAKAGDPKLPARLYFSQEECVHFLNVTLFRCATSQVGVAALAIYGWSILTSIVREIAWKHRSLREKLIESTNDDTEQPGGSRRRGSREWTSDFEHLNEFLASHDLGEARDDPARFFASVAIERMRVFSLIANLSTAIDSLYSWPAESSTAFICKEVLLDAVREGLLFVEYDVEVLEAVLLTIMPDDSNATSRTHARLLASKFFSDDKIFRPAILEQALARYPYELSPLLRLCRTLTRVGPTGPKHVSPLEMVQLLDNLRSMTQMVPEDFRSYQLDHEDENTNTMTLTDALPVFGVKPSLITWNPDQAARRALLPASHGSPNESHVMTIPAGTPGVLVKETRPFVLKLENTHSGLEYLGILLSTFQANAELIPVIPGAALDRFTATDLILLLSALLSAALEKKGGKSEALFILGRFGYVLANEQDIISVIADVFEAELLAHLDQVAEDGSLELVTACAEFLVLLVDVSPERAWSCLARSSLLGVNGSAVSLAAVVGGTEAQLGRYRFLTACVRLYDSLLNDTITGLIKRKFKSSKAVNRFDSPVESSGPIPARTISNVLGAYQKILLDAFQNLSDWRFEAQQEKYNIVSMMLKTFTKLFKSTYGINMGKETSNRLTGVLSSAAEALLELCAPAAGLSPLISTCARILPDALPVANDSIPGQARIALISQTNSLLEFLGILLRAAKSTYGLLSNGASAPLTTQTPSGGIELQGRARNLATDILKSMPVFAALLAGDHVFKSEIFLLLSELVQTINTDELDPPSILSQLDAETAKSFLQIVTQLDRPLCDPHVERQAWDFLAAIMSNKQQWFAVYLLTGTLPRDRAKQDSNPAAKHTSLLSYALDQLSNITTLSPERAAGMLRFVAFAQQTWVWATNDVRSHTNFLKNTLAWLGSIEAPSGESGPAAAIISAKEYEMATYLCDILAINVHAGLEVGDIAILRPLVPRLNFLRDHGVIVNTYNRSLHKKLAENVKRKFPHSELTDFERTKVNPAPFGTEYFYDRDFAAAVLRHDLAWEGADRNKNHGFSSEFSRASANLSLYDAQMGLTASWKALASTLCECADRDAALQFELAQVAERCLTANTNSEADEPRVADLLKLRVELAFVISSRLVSLRVSADSMKDLLPACWELLRTSPVDYDVSTTSEDVDYYRNILRVLYLAIQPHQYMNVLTRPPQATDETPVQYLEPRVASCLVNVVRKVVAPGFRALCANLHTDIQLAQPADFTLLTAILNAILAVPGVSSIHTLITDAMTGSSVVRGALSLLSWADQLAEVMDQDPVYGELAVMFLLALSTVRPVAEQMALEGVLTQLSSANLSNYFRKPGGKGPFDEPQRMFVIWSGGFLPLCLNLLFTVGPPIAAEVAAFLNSFPEQLRRAQGALQNATPTERLPRAGAVTLGLISEASSLTTIASFLSSDVARGAAEGIDAADVPALQYNADAVRELVESLLRSKRSLSDRITAVGPVEARWQNTTTTGASDNLLMAKVLKVLFSLQESLGEPCM